MPHAKSEGTDEVMHGSVQSDLDILCSSIDTNVSVDSISKQRSPRSACAFAQSDQGLRCSQTA